jgi:hypothetical protein
VKTFNCTHPGHEGDRETEGVPFGPVREEWCEACWWWEQEAMRGRYAWPDDDPDKPVFKRLREAATA